jgi:hypothetical protein
MKITMRWEHSYDGRRQEMRTEFWWESCWLHDRPSTWDDNGTSASECIDSIEFDRDCVHWQALLLAALEFVIWSCIQLAEQLLTANFVSLLIFLVVYEHINSDSSFVQK